MDTVTPGCCEEYAIGTSVPELHKESITDVVNWLALVNVVDATLDSTGYANVFLFINVIAIFMMMACWLEIPPSIQLTCDEDDSELRKGTADMVDVVEVPKP